MRVRGVTQVRCKKQRCEALPQRDVSHVGAKVYASHRDCRAGLCRAPNIVDLPGRVYEFTPLIRRSPLLVLAHAPDLAQLLRHSTAANLSKRSCRIISLRRPAARLPLGFSLEGV